MNLLTSLRLRLTSVQTFKADRVRAIDPKSPLFQDAEGREMPGRDSTGNLASLLGM